MKRHDNASKDAANKSGAREVLRLLSAHARRRLHETSRQGAAGPWPEVIDVLARAERHLDANVNMKQALENLVAQWTGVVHRAAAGV